MPNYNCSRFLAQTIDSVISQTYQEWELLIVDDKSTDDSVSIIQKYQEKDSRIKLFINKTNSGASYSRNTALLNTKGVYIAFLDSDDLWVPNKLEKQVKFMNDNNCDFSYTEYSLIDEGNAFYFMTHTEFSRSSDYIAYLFRWIDKNDNSRMKRKTKIVVYSFKDEDFYILPSDFMASHFVWNDNDNILAYCTVNGQNGHVIFDISNLNDITYNIIAPTILNSDGHQSFITNDSFVTDTYPDKYRVSKIYKVETNPERIEKLVSVYSPKKFQSKTFYNHIACDLHPRISKDRKYLSFDTCYTGKRSLCVMKLYRD